MLHVYVNGWKPIIGEPRPINRGRNKGKVEVQVKFCNSEGLYSHKIITKPEKLRDFFNHNL